MEKVTEKAPAPYKRRFGDRSDGRRMRTIEPMSQFAVFVMQNRNDANNYITDCVDLEVIDKYVHKKRAEGKDGFNAMYVLVGAYVRAVSQKPGINRFISGLRIYARNDIQVSMDVKKELKLNAEETMLKFHFKPDYTMDQIYEEMHSKIKEYQEAPVPEEVSGVDKFAKTFVKSPRWVIKLLIKTLNWLDYHGWVPAPLLEVSPFHGSMVLTSMGSLGIPSVYHHLYNFGNVPMFISFSTKRHAYELNRDGQVERKHYLDFNITTDERVCDGQYYSEALHELRRNLKNPELLDNPPDSVVEDIE